MRSDTPSTYRDDLFNVVDMLALHLLLASEIAYWATDDDNDVYLPLRAFAVRAIDLLRALTVVCPPSYRPSQWCAPSPWQVLALDVRLLRLIYLSPKLGALVLLLVRMTVDLLKLFVLLVFVVFSLVSALYVVEQATWRAGDAAIEAARTPACDDFYILGGSWTHWGKLLFLVLNAVVDGRAQVVLDLHSGVPPPPHPSSLTVVCPLPCDQDALFMCVLP